MFKSAVQLTFPCPACGGFVTLRTFRAEGPCPACGTNLEVNLYVQPRIPDGQEAVAQSGAPVGAKRFELRRFRPATHQSPQS